MKVIKISSIVLLSILVLAAILLYRPDIKVEKLQESYFSHSSAWLDWEGMKVHYSVEGNGPPLILIHGTFSSLHTWDDWAAQLQNDFTIIRMDLQGFGLSGPHPNHDYSPEAYSRLVVALLDHLQITSCYMAGNSLGGLITWNTAVNYPDRIEKMILLDASGIPKQSGGRPWIFDLASNKTFGKVLSKFTPRFLFKMNMEQVYFDKSKMTEELIDRYYYLLRREGNREAFIVKSGRNYPLPPAQNLADMSIPTLIMWGKYDQWIPYTDAFEFEKLLRNSKLIIYENAGHVPMEEIPAESALDAKNFLTY
jgi:pimeloyl-ACP methyl ester carboxylesterase